MRFNTLQNIGNNIGTSKNTTPFTVLCLQGERTSHIKVNLFITKLFYPAHKILKILSAGKDKLRDNRCSDIIFGSYITNIL